MFKWENNFIIISTKYFKQIKNWSRNEIMSKRFFNQIILRQISINDQNYCEKVIDSNYLNLNKKWKYNIEFHDLPLQKEAKSSKMYFNSVLKLKLNDFDEIFQNLKDPFPKDLRDAKLKETYDESLQLFL